MSDLLSIGASGVRAYQGALGTVSENIAGVGVEGYTRRTATLREVSAPSEGFAARGASRGYGVLLGGVQRQADAFRAGAVRDAGSDLARTEAGAAWLDRIEQALDGGAAVARVSGFFAAARTLAADPYAAAPRAGLLEAASSAAAAFAGTASALDGVRDELDAAGDDAAGQVTALAGALAKLNDRIGRVAEGSGAAANLADERDRLLERMSALADLDVSVDGGGRAAVRIGGAAGPVLVAGAEAGVVTFARSANGVATFGVHRAGETRLVQPAGGAMAGVVEGAGRVFDARAALNGVAADFTRAVNDAQAAGETPAGAAGQPLFAAGATAAEMQVAMFDPAGIAAASPGTGPRNGGNLQALEAARDAVSGVDLDGEAVDLLRFQQAYQASSRVIQVARETFQTILDSGR